MALLGAVVVSGLAGVASSVMVYHAVRREFWHASYGGVKFAGTAAILGLATALAAQGVAEVRRPHVPDVISSYGLWIVALGLIATTSAKLGFEARLVRGFERSKLLTLRKTSLLLRGALKRQAGLRQLLGVAGGIVLPALAIAASAWAGSGTTAAVAILALAASIGAETAERYLFFAAVVRPKMPGGMLP